MFGNILELFLFFVQLQRFEIKKMTLFFIQNITNRIRQIFRVKARFSVTYELIQKAQYLTYKMSKLKKCQMSFQKKKIRPKRQS